ncbi:MAG TPA: D-2-hydroxyacid dehydrogenase family protein [Xanthobacteraceae bacterium]|nr:D-2-hydroxyacid dehydrogenase family protein [Xanthobacteraceae bacterium]
MLRIGIPDDYADVARALPSFAKIAGHEVSIWTDAAPDLDSLAKRLANIEALVLLRERTPITAALVARLPALKLITISGPYPNIDVAACTAHGIAVAAAANRPTMATPELTWGLIMSALRHIPGEVARLKAGGWQRQMGRVLHGKTLGILGFGRIGKVVAGYGRAFGMRVQVWSRERGQAEARAAGFEIADGLDALFAGADVLSVHLRLTNETRAMITGALLARMSSTSLFVNTSRAELIVPGALVAALKAGQPGAAAIDVFEHEPVIGARDPLLALPNALCTPHLGFVALDPLEEYFADQYDRVLAFEAGKPVDVVNPQVL